MYMRHASAAKSNYTLCELSGSCCSSYDSPRSRVCAAFWDLLGKRIGRKENVMSESSLVDGHLNETVKGQATENEKTDKITSQNSSWFVEGAIFFARPTL